jgi:hypothetical protein
VAMLRVVYPRSDPTVRLLSRSESE